MTTDTTAGENTSGTIDADAPTARTVVTDAVTTGRSSRPLLPFVEWCEAVDCTRDTTWRLVEMELEAGDA